ncbi:MAG: Hsp20/alpha crystallin family protein [Candidatus Aenigmatarchaeota archaeon]
MKKKKRDFRFFWEEPFEKTMKNFFEEPFEFKFTFPRLTFPETRRTIPISIGQTDKEIIVRAELPGFKKDEINLNVTENYIEISAEKKEEKTKKTEHEFYHEKSVGTVKRAFTLPEHVDPEKTEAKLEDGILTIIMPKLYPETKKKKKIEIK